jgi:5-methylcytosine-specific restriction endonuclease McrA
MCWSASGQAVEANTVDHITPHKGDAELFWKGELQSLCGPCHSRLKQQEEARGYHSAVDADGYPIDPNHPANNLRP